MKEVRQKEKRAKDCKSDAPGAGGCGGQKKEEEEEELDAPQAPPDPHSDLFGPSEALQKHLILVKDLHTTFCLSLDPSGRCADIEAKQSKEGLEKSLGIQISATWIKAVEKSLEALTWKFYHETAPGVEKHAVYVADQKSAGVKDKILLVGAPQGLSLMYAGPISTTPSPQSKLVATIAGIQFFVCPVPTPPNGDILVPAWSAKATAKTDTITLTPEVLRMDLFLMANGSIVHEDPSEKFEDRTEEVEYINLIQRQNGLLRQKLEGKNASILKLKLKLKAQAFQASKLQKLCDEYDAAKQEKSEEKKAEVEQRERSHHDTHDSSEAAGAGALMGPAEQHVQPESAQVPPLPQPVDVESPLVSAPEPKSQDEKSNEDLKAQAQGSPERGGPAKEAKEQEQIASEAPGPTQTTESTETKTNAKTETEADGQSKDGDDSKERKEEIQTPALEAGHGVDGGLPSAAPRRSMLSFLTTNISPCIFFTISMTVSSSMV